MSYVYVVEVHFKDGRVTQPVMVSEADPDHQDQVDAALKHFEALYGASSTVEVVYARDLASAGVATPERIRTWKDFQARPWG